MKNKRTYAVVIEKGPSSWGAYVPDLPGCVAVGKTSAEARKMIREAIEFHLEGMQLAGETLPKPSAIITEISATLPALAHA
ncbi:MAG: type II toxin-antitoxin system HicB family antitoxin [Kiritimatiellia bacterium]|jgi:predicted RNase H-like HicB family nuclease